MMELFGFLDCCPLWIPLGLLALVLLLVYGYHPMSTWKRLGIPHPPALPFIGNVHEYLNPKIGIVASIDKWQKQYGKVFGIQLFRKPCLIVSDPEFFNDILVKDFNSFHDRYSIGDHLIPDAVLNGVAFQSGPDWKRNRRILTPIFTAGKLKLITGYMNTTARHLACKLHKNAETEAETKAKEVFGAYSLDVIAGTAFGLEINSQQQEDGGIYEKVVAIFVVKTIFKLILAISGIFPFTDRLVKLMNLSVFNPDSIEYFRVFLTKLVEERKNNPEQFKRWDFFKLCLTAEAEAKVGQDMTSERVLRTDEIVSSGITFIMAGYETTSATLQFLTYALAKNPEVQEKLVSEIESVFSDAETSDVDIEVTYDDCHKLKYMEAVLMETLRMYPPVLQIKRKAVRETTLKGIPIPKDTGVMIPVYNVSRDPEVFPDPNSFRPERFLSDGNNLSSSAKSVCFLPFGFGPRQCLGMRLALVEMKIALVHVLRKVRVQSAKPEKLEFEDYTGFLTPVEPLKFTMNVVE